jgi:hypothetical protein
MDWPAYIEQTSALLRLTLNHESRIAVARNLQLIAAMNELVNDAALTDADEPAPSFCASPTRES